MKNFLLILVLSLIVLAIIWTSSLVSAKYPDFLVPKNNNIVLRKTNVENLTIKTGTNINLDFLLYNNSTEDQEAVTGFFLLEEGKTYDGINLDYVSRRQKRIIPTKTSEEFNWSAPIYLPPGEYKLLIWIHKIENGAEIMVKDSWYPEIIKITENPDKENMIKGDDANPGTDYYISNLLISPNSLKKKELVVFEYKVKSNLEKSGKIVSGIYLINKEKKYDGKNIDYKLGPYFRLISGKSSVVFNFKSNLDLPTGEYKVLIWIHKRIENKEELVEDYFAPGIIEITP